ncbi:MAG: TonB-dependent receptor [Planctomycetes bacterium]|nr:TonB-dependent receptor [Planctomycetota bacterium]
MPSTFTRFALASILGSCALPSALAQDVEDSGADLTELSLEDLLQLDVVVTSASKHEQTLARTAAAVHVITAQDIERSGATSLAEVLRLAPGVDVARLDSNRWAVSIRGFNGQFANKILVLVDGRSIYTPLFSGTLWDTADMPLEEIERIEVIRGPGGALWGANAVNGIVNVITKRAEDTVGGLVTMTLGDLDRVLGYARHGASAENGAWRAWGRWTDRGPTGDPAGGDGEDDWSLASVGFRGDFRANDRDTWTLQGGGYAGRVDGALTAAAPPPQYVSTATDHADVDGATLQSRWQRTFGEGDALAIQGYVDHYRRDHSFFVEERSTLGLEFERHLPLGASHAVTWGASTRASHSDTEDTFVVAWRDNQRTDVLFGAFLQDEVTLVPDRWSLTLGTKAEHEDSTGSNLQPSARLLFSPSERQSWWCSVSRAVATPSQAAQDVELVQAIVPGMPNQYVTIFGDRDVEPETVDAIELGWRVRPTERLECDFAVHFDRYHDLILFEPGAPYVSGTDVIVPLVSTNAPEAEGFGVEAHIDWIASDDTLLTLTWTSQEIDIDPDGALSPVVEDDEITHPETQWSLRVQHDFDELWRCDALLWRVEDVELGAVPDYWRLDANVHRKLGRHGSVTLGVQNVLHDGEPEFGDGYFNASNEMRSAFYVRTTWSF